MSRAEIDAVLDTYPLITAETKPEDWGRIDDEVVALDYGITSDMATEQRDYFASRGSAEEG